MNPPSYGDVRRQFSQHVDLGEAAERLDRDLETVWDELSTWAGLEDELRLHDRSRRRKSERTGATAD